MSKNKICRPYSSPAKQIIKIKKVFMDIYENKKESFRRRFENMSDLSVRELTYGDMKICIFYISNFCSKI